MIINTIDNKIVNKELNSMKEAVEFLENYYIEETEEVAEVE